MSSYLEERFPHIIPRVIEAWGDTKAFCAMFNDLIFDSRGGRSGWPETAWQELEFINSLHKTRCKDVPPDAEKEAEEAELEDDVKWLN